MHDAERDRVWIPDDPKECSEEAVLKVRQSLEAMLKSIGNRRMMGVEAAMEDWVSPNCLDETSPPEL